LNIGNFGAIKSRVSIYVLSANRSFIDLVKAALKVDALNTFSGAADVISALLAGSRSKWELLIIDLGSAGDGGRLLDFIKSSAPIHAIRVMVVGTPDQLAALGEVPGGSADATVQAPCTVGEISAAVAKLRYDAGVLPGGVIPPPGERRSDSRA